MLPDIKPTPEELENIRATKPVASLASLVNESPTLQVENLFFLYKIGK